MATRLYFHSPSSSVSGTLPSTEQSTSTTTTNYDAQTVNRIMDTTIGTSETSLGGSAKTYASTLELGYFTKFVSKRLDLTSITAQTWTISLGFADSTAGGVNNVIDCTNPGVKKICVYVWRPSTGAKVGNIFDGSSSTTSAVATTPFTKRCTKVNFAGSAITCQVNDVIVCEIWYGICGNTDNTATFYYDGTDDTKADNATVTSMASYLETPQNITFVPDFIPPEVATVIRSKTHTTRFGRK